MLKHNLRAVLFVLCVAGVGIAAESPSPGDRVVAYCKAHNGKRVGRGECTSLAEAALSAAGAQRHPWRSLGHGDFGEGDVERSDDYIWGELVYVLEREPSPTAPLKATGQFSDVHPGDIIQFRNVELAGAHGNGHYTVIARHHTAIVSSVGNRGMLLKIYQQNYNGRKIVTTDTLRLSDLQQGRLRIFRPIPRTGPRWTDE